ncbi:unnamed protein product [Calicophoron daubneyi]|uniref:Uncharacterized protein n=1 Tax=Calicophoron daubneyi TaxID=300641 RepID=A0AAV2TPE5_CALDB
MSFSVDDVKALLQYRQEQFEAAQLRFIQFFTAKLSAQAPQFQLQPTQARSTKSIPKNVSEFQSAPNPGVNFDAWFKRHEEAAAREQEQKGPAENLTVQHTEVKPNERILGKSQTKKQAVETLDVGEIKEVEGINSKQPLKKKKIRLAQEKAEKVAGISSVSTPNLHTNDTCDKNYDHDNTEHEKDKSTGGEEDSDEKEEENEELLLSELANIERERSGKPARLESEWKSAAETIRMENMLKGNPLLKTGANSEIKVKRRLNDIVVYKNSARGDTVSSAEALSKKTLSNQPPKESVSVQRKKKNRTVANRTHLVPYAWKRRKRKKPQGGRCGVEAE